MNKLIRMIRGNTIAGIIIIIPLIATIWLIVKLFVFVDSVLPSLVHTLVAEVPEKWFPGAGIFIILFFAFLTGLVARFYLGTKLIKTGNTLISKIPFINKLYVGIQQIIDAVLNNKKKIFERVVLVEFPRPGYYVIGFLTAQATPEISEKAGQKAVAVLVPLSPTPTQGFLFFTHESELIDIDISVETALKLIVSGGIFSSDTVHKDHYGIPHSLKDWNWVRDLKRWNKDGVVDPRD
jgi:uncharacterized membrane protein